MVLDPQVLSLEPPMDNSFCVLLNAKPCTTGHRTERQAEIFTLHLMPKQIHQFTPGAYQCLQHLLSDLSICKRDQGRATMVELGAGDQCSSCVLCFISHEPRSLQLLCQTEETGKHNWNVTQSPPKSETNGSSPQVHSYLFNFCLLWITLFQDINS